MNVSKEVKDKIRELARRFTNNTPPLCREHKPDGLPIDSPTGVDIGENHPAHKFEKLVKQESDNQDLDVVDRSLVRIKLREIFAKEYHKNSSKRSCIQCYDEGDDESIRMELPDDSDIR